ncbi:MAG TPA: pantoate--beta-alanine ligase [Actinocrinis sp.]|uniref:pantoate--beta-alanine ligase n=1 Tax=Actinocrinis sp. TaxID=1920516 RepID=UPI002DDD9FBB|nr:pantoate--beta-alanine ligase [Actinocrinis sp.]HEV2343900.1 pantoate--beta-alanine ligase [Actinocrinis sp.]
MTRVVHTRADLEAARAGRFGGTAVVMTMGALHDGHLALIHAARQAAKTVVVTIFVNPLQFGPGEDFERYPRTLDEDVEQCEALDVDVVFAPSVDEVYPGGPPAVTVDPGPMGELLEGASRPGHFGGMLTVVLKLLNLTAPDLAFFGQKDAQQLAMIRRMALDFNLPVEIVGVRTVREPDGLALSSRNRYLSDPQRQTALALSRALAEGAIQPTAAAVRTAARAVLDEAARAEPPLVLDYLALVDPGNFHEVPDDYTGNAILALAAKVGTTRLIDNTPLTITGPTITGEAK